MFLSRRSMQAEYFDAERSAPELKEFFRSLSFFNRLFGFAQPFQFGLPNLLNHENCQALSILDVGSGDGSLGKVLSRWAEGHKWTWKVTNLDSNWVALCLNPQGQNVAASAIALPFRDASFDAVIASQMVHHLDDANVEQLLREAWRVTRRGLLISDLHRGFLLYVVIWLLLRLRSHPSAFCADALLSVRRGWRAKDLKSLASRAGLSSAQVGVQFASRVILSARK